MDTIIVEQRVNLAEEASTRSWAQNSGGKYARRLALKLGHPDPNLILTPTLTP